jgi:NAD(P)-dependent dehydrogenase (short-subunit alcohol dehydrogenase family)
MGEAPLRLSDKTIIVTGSTTGIGEAIARRCVGEGARVLVHGRDRDRAERVAGELGGSAAAHVDDLSDPEAAPRIVAAAVQRFGGLDGIVNNAALTTRSSLATTDAAAFDRVMAVNLRAPMLLVRAAVEHLRHSKGCVLNIGSTNGHCGEANLLAYSMSKAALMTMSRNLADALGRDGVRVNHFNVGWVLTPNEYKTKVSDGLEKNWPQRVSAVFAPSGRILDPDDIASAAVYWLADESRPISGSVVDLEQYPVIGRNPAKG